MDDIYVYHGKFRGCHILKILDQIKEFMVKNPGEFITCLLKLEKGNKMKPEQTSFLLDKVKQIFDGLLVTNKKNWFQFGDTTLGDIAGQKERLLIFFDTKRYLSPVTYKGVDFSSENKVEINKLGFFLDSEFRNIWHRTQHPEFLFKANIAELEATAKDHTDKLINNQLTLTPMISPGCFDALKFLICVETSRPDTVTRQLHNNRQLAKFVRENSGLSWNFLFLDFIDFCPLLIKFITGLNYSEELTIKKAVFTDISTKEVTQLSYKTMEKISRKNSLFLIDFKEDLSLDFNVGYFSLVYTYGQNEPLKVKTIKVQKDTMLLINYEIFKEENIEGILEEGDSLSGDEKRGLIALGDPRMHNESEDNTAPVWISGEMEQNDSVREAKNYLKVEVKKDQKVKVSMIKPM